MKSVPSLTLFLLLLLFGIRSMEGATRWPIDGQDHSSIRGAKWWILHRYSLPQLHNIPTLKFQKWFTNRQWRQFMSLQAGGRRSRTVNRQLFEAAIVGVKRALHECQHQFKFERWNCSRLSRNEAGSIFGRLLLRGSPETAFVHAIISAGIVQSVAEACLRIPECPCNNRGRRETDGSFRWQGCDHNVRFGKKFSRRLMDVLEEGRHIRFRMIAHNNEAGRRNVVRHLQKSCRCHGTSGSCVMKTCFRKTPSMRVIGTVLKQQYKKVVKVIQDNTIHAFDGKTEVATAVSPLASVQDNSLSWSYPNRRRTSTRRRPRARYPGRTRGRNRNRNNKRRRKKRTSFLLRADSIRRVPPARTALVFYEDVGEDFYCERRPEWNVAGTAGRVCNSTSPFANKCRHLCCKRGFLTVHYNKIEQCRCRFMWCCKVECDKCEVTKARETCV